MTPEAENVKASIATAAITRHLQAIRHLWPITGWIQNKSERTMKPVFGPRSPANDEAISVRYDAQLTLTSWAGVVIETRDLHPQLIASDVPAVAAFIEPHAALLAALDGDGAEHEIGQLARRLQALAAGTKVRVLRLGACPVEGCTAWLLGILHEDQPAAVRCGGQEQHQWPRERWEHLGLTLAPAQRQGWERLARTVKTVQVRPEFL